MTKNIISIVSTPGGNYICTWPKISLEGFSKEINAGPGECVLKLDKVFDYQGTDLQVGNNVQIRVSDKDTVADPTYSEGARTVYEGYISLIERDVDGAKEQVTVHLLGYYTLLGTDILKDGVNSTLYTDPTDGLIITGPSDAADIGLIARAVIDRYRAENDSPRISYDAGDVPNTGSTVHYRFQQKTYREALEKLRLMAPAGTFYYINESGMLKFGQKPSTPTHKFIFGKHFNSVHVEQSLEKVRNFFLIWNGEPTGSVVYNHYQDDASIAKYGRRSEVLQDNGIDDDDAADSQGASLLAQSKEPEIKVTCIIMDNNLSDNFGYDIESIQPGDTCSFYGFDSSLLDIFQDNMLITAVNYKLDRVELEVEVIKSGIIDLQNQQGKQIEDAINKDLPDTFS